jgi:hypothetical protein
MAALSTALNIARSSLATVSGKRQLPPKHCVGNADYSQVAVVIPWRAEVRLPLHPTADSSVRQDACRFLEFRASSPVLMASSV